MAQPNPVIAAQQPNPVIAAQQPNPVIAAQQPNPVIAQQQQPNPVIVQQQQPNPVVVQQPNPVVVQQQQQPEIAIAAQQPNPEIAIAAQQQPNPTAASLIFKNVTIKLKPTIEIDQFLPKNVLIPAFPVENDNNNYDVTRVQKFINALKVGFNAQLLCNPNEQRYSGTFRTLFNFTLDSSVKFTSDFVFTNFKFISADFYTEFFGTSAMEKIFGCVSINDKDDNQYFTFSKFTVLVQNDTNEGSTGPGFIENNFDITIAPGQLPAPSQAEKPVIVKPLFAMPAIRSYSDISREIDFKRILSQISEYYTKSDDDDCRRFLIILKYLVNKNKDKFSNEEIKTIKDKLINNFYTWLGLKERMPDGSTGEANASQMSHMFYDIVNKTPSVGVWRKGVIKLKQTEKIPDSFSIYKKKLGDLKYNQFIEFLKTGFTATLFTESEVSNNPSSMELIRNKDNVIFLAPFVFKDIIKQETKKTMLSRVKSVLNFTPEKTNYDYLQLFFGNSKSLDMGSYSSFYNCSNPEIFTFEPTPTTATTKVGGRKTKSKTRANTKSKTRAITKTKPKRSNKNPQKATRRCQQK